MRLRFWCSNVSVKKCINHEIISIKLGPFLHLNYLLSIHTLANELRTSEKITYRAMLYYAYQLNQVIGGMVDIKQSILPMKKEKAYRLNLNLAY